MCDLDHMNSDLGAGIGSCPVLSEYEMMKGVSIVTVQCQCKEGFEVGI
jgi:hypothetical protein